MERLFLVRFNMDNFADAQGKNWGTVPITVLAGDETRKPLVPPEVGIKDYDSDPDPLKLYSLYSLFSEDEAQKLVAYLKEKESLEAETVAVELPIDSISPWLEEMDPEMQGFMGVSEAMCLYMDIRLAAYFDLRESATWKEMNA